MDFLRLLPSGEYPVVVIDEYSRLPEVEIITSTFAKSTIPKLNAIFARRGIPDVLKSGNGPPPPLMAWSSRTLLSIWVFTTAKSRRLANGKWRSGTFHEDTREMRENRHH